MFKSSSLATTTDGGKSKSREIELSDATWADWAEMIHEDLVDKHGGRVGQFMEPYVNRGLGTNVKIEWWQPAFPKLPVITKAIRDKLMFQIDMDTTQPITTPSSARQNQSQDLLTPTSNFKSSSSNSSGGDKEYSIEMFEEPFEKVRVVPTAMFNTAVKVYEKNWERMDK